MPIEDAVAEPESPRGLTNAPAAPYVSNCYRAP